MTLVPIAVFWLLVFIGMRYRSSLHLYLLFATMSLGSFAVIPTNLSAGLTITGPPVVVCFMLLNSLLRKNSIQAYLGAAIDFRMLGFLFAYLVVAIAVTYFAPRFFHNVVDVVPMKLKTVGLMGADRLQPTKQNVSQLLYLGISVSAVFMFSRMFDSVRGRERILGAFRFGAGFAVLTGWLDLASTKLPIEPLLDLFRTGGYALMTDNFVGGYKRAVGLMPEASAFGAICLFYLCFLYFSRFSLVRCGTAAIACYYFLMANLVGLLATSISSSAYLGLGVFAGMASLEWLYRKFFIARSSVLKTGLNLELMACVGFSALLVVVVATMPAIREELVVRLDRLIFSKSESISYEERSMWSEVSFNSLFQTYGIGCGLGGTRASNKVISIFSNTGVLGGLLYYVFVVQCLLRRPRGNRCDINLVHAVRWSFLPIFAVEFLVGTTPDMGLQSAWMFGMASAVSFESYNHNLDRQSEGSEVIPGIARLSEMSERNGGIDVLYR